MKTYKEMVKEIKRPFMELLRSTDAALESVKECMQAGAFAPSAPLRKPL